MEERAKILVVDYDPEFSANLQAVFEAKAYQVVTARDMGQAQEIVCHEKLALIILGTIVPMGDTFRLNQWLKQNVNTRRLPLIMVDASPEKQLTRGWGMEGELWNDAENYFCRPIEPSAMVPIVEKLLNNVTGKIKVLVVDDHTAVRQGIHAVVDLQRDMHVVGEAVNGREAVAKTRQLLPDVVLMDIVMPDMDGLEATKRICEEYPQVKVLMLSQYDDEENVHASERAGAFGFVPKRSAGSELIAGIRAASRVEQLRRKVTERIKVLVAEDHAVVREGIHAVVDLQRDMHVVGEAVDGREALAKTRQLLPDVVLMDIVMPDMSGLEATKRICKECPQVKVLMLSQYDDEENVHASAQAGAFGFIPKRSPGSELIAGIRSASRGEHFKRPVAA